MSMTSQHDQGHDQGHGSHGTRMLFLGEASLADGFRLIGFETHPNPSPEETERVFRDLSRSRERAFVVLDDRVMAQDIPSLKRVRLEGGRIVVIAVPRLDAPPVLSSEVADRLTALFGAGAPVADAGGSLAHSGDVS